MTPVPSPPTTPGGTVTEPSACSVKVTLVEIRAANLAATGNEWQFGFPLVGPASNNESGPTTGDKVKFGADGKVASGLQLPLDIVSFSIPDGCGHTIQFTIKIEATQFEGFNDAGAKSQDFQERCPGRVRREMVMQVHYHGDPKKPSSTLTFVFEIDLRC